MFIGRVIGTVWSTIKWPGLDGLKLLAVQPYHLRDLASEEQPAPSCEDLVICADVLDAGVGDRVIIAYGHAARVALEDSLGPGQKPSTPIDAAIVAVIDDFSVDQAALDDAPTSS